MNEAQVREAGWVVQSVVGASAYIYGVEYDHDRFVHELDAAVGYIKEHAPHE